MTDTSDYLPPEPDVLEQIRQRRNQERVRDVRAELTGKRLQEDERLLDGWKETDRPGSFVKAASGGAWVLRSDSEITLELRDADGEFVAGRVLVRRALLKATDEPKESE